MNSNNPNNTEAFSFEEVEAWLGSDITMDELISIVMDIANKDYPVEMLINDIDDYRHLA